MNQDWFPRAASGGEVRLWLRESGSFYRLECGFREQRHGNLEDSGACVFRAQFAAHVAAVDRFAEDGCLPERERFEPCERLDLAAAPLGVALDELRARRETGLSRHR